MNHEERALIRRILEEELDGFLPDTVVPADRAAVEREQQDPGGLSYEEARRRYIRQAAFTILNRPLALRVAEANGLLTETVVVHPEYGDRSHREWGLAGANSDLAVRPEDLAHTALQEAFNEFRQLFGTDEPYALLLPPPGGVRYPARIPLTAV